MSTNLFFSQLNSRHILWRKSSKKDEVWICHGRGCLENGQRTPDRRFRLGVNLRTGYAGCFNCGWGSKNRERTMKSLAYWFSVDVSSFLMVEGEQEEEKSQPAVKIPSEFIQFGSTCDIDDEYEREAWHYLTEKRKVPPEQLVKKRVGYAITGKYAYRIIFPFWDEDNKLAGIVARAYIDKEPRYLNSANEGGFQRSFYNAHKLPKLQRRKREFTAVLSEGIFDALAIERSTSYLSLATFGTEFTEKQIDLLAGIKQLVIFADNDFTGLEAAIKNACVLSAPNREILITYSSLQNCKDASELAEAGKPESIVKLIHSAVVYNDSSALHLRSQMQLARIA